MQQNPGDSGWSPILGEQQNLDATKSRQQLLVTNSW